MIDPRVTAYKTGLSDEIKEIIYKGKQEAGRI